MGRVDLLLFQVWSQQVQDGHANKSHPSGALEQVLISPALLHTLSQGMDVCLSPQRRLFYFMVMVLEAPLEKTWKN